MSLGDVAATLAILQMDNADDATVRHTTGAAASDGGVPSTAHQPDVRVGLGGRVDSHARAGVVPHGAGPPPSSRSFTDPVTAPSVPARDSESASSLRGSMPPSVPSSSPSVFLWNRGVMPARKALLAVTSHPVHRLEDFEVAVLGRCNRRGYSSAHG